MSTDIMVYNDPACPSKADYPTLRSCDQGYVLSRLPAAVRRAMEMQDDDLLSHGKIILGGGWIRDCISKVEPSDVDLFVGSQRAADHLKNVLAISRGSEGVRQMSSTEFAHTLWVEGENPSSPLVRVQVVFRWLFDSPKAMLDHYDFTICRAAIWCRLGRWESMIDPWFYADLAAKRLSYAAPPGDDAEPGGSLLRAMKFAARGFTMPLDDLGTLVSYLADKSIPPGTGTAFDRQQSVVANLRRIDPSTGDFD